MEEIGDRGDKPSCAHTISVMAPINWGVAVVFSRAASSSTILPMLNQREAFSFCDMGVSCWLYSRCGGSCEYRCE